MQQGGLKVSLLSIMHKCSRHSNASKSDLHNKFNLFFWIVC